MLALNSFPHFSDGIRDLTSYTKDILKGLRELKRSSPLASEMLKVLVDENESKADIWIHKELIQVDCKENGEVLSVICSKDKIFSGHTDGSIKNVPSKKPAKYLPPRAQKGRLLALPSPVEPHMGESTSEPNIISVEG
ncbi:hypothetical protein SESBI_34435 [Sesbania bispinosa]|nr:hypothetical protein SESBI_34435 [Sesbania bispinosa]